MWRQWILVTFAAFILLHQGSRSSAYGAETSAEACERLLLEVMQPERDYMGAIWVTDGRGGVKERIIQLHPRNEEARPLLDLIEAAAANLTQPTVLYLRTHDNDVWDQWARDAQPSQQAARLSHVLLQCPCIFFLAWNPTVDVNGRLGPRTFPIPDFEALRGGPERPTIVDFQARSGLAAWRGVTTGAGGNGGYQTTDRFRMVKLLSSVPTADVKFSGRVQDVPETIVTPDLVGGAMHPPEMLTRRVVMDVDGNANAWEGLRWKLRAGGTVVKVVSSRRYVQWYYHLLQNGRQLRLVDLEKEDLVKAVAEIGGSASIAMHMSRTAQAFGDAYLTPAAAKRWIADVIPRVWELNSIFSQMDWRIRATTGVEDAERPRCPTQTESGGDLHGNYFLPGRSSQYSPTPLECNFTVRCPATHPVAEVTWFSPLPNPEGSLRIVDASEMEWLRLGVLEGTPGSVVIPIADSGARITYRNSHLFQRPPFNLTYRCTDTKLAVRSPEVVTGSPSTHHVLADPPLSALGDAQSSLKASEWLIWGSIPAALSAAILLLFIRRRGSR